jgi:transposase
MESERLVFLDESGMRLGSTCRYGWAAKGVKALGKAVHGAWSTITMIGAIGLDGFRAFMNIESGTSGDVFRAFVEQALVPNLRHGDCVVMDNLSAHKNAGATAAIRAAGADVYFLPPYSPEYNPIEKVWSKLKEFVRRCETRTREGFDDAVAKAMNDISKSDILAWYKYCGYTIKLN